MNNKLKSTSNPYGIALYISLAALSLLRLFYILHGPLDLSADEALYWDCTRHLDLSYYSKGPLIVYMMYVTTSLFGTNVFAIRMMAVVLSFLSSVFLYKLVVAMYRNGGDSTSGQQTKGHYYGDERFLALLCAMLLQIIPLFATYGIVFTIDSPFVFLWILSLYLLWNAIDERKGAKKGIMPWVALGVSVGLGFQAKYIMAFFYICALLFFITNDKGKWLRSPKTYLAMVISLVVFSPVIIWNMQHEWVTLKHTGGHAHLADGLRISLKSFGEFIGTQAGVVTPVLFVMMPIALFDLRRREKTMQSSFLFYFSIPVLAFFLLNSVQGRVEANWAMAGYITGIIAFVRYYFYARGDNVPRIRGKHTRRLVYAAIITAFVVTAVSHFPYVLRLPPKIDPSEKLRGWKSLGEEVSSIYWSMSKEGSASQVFIFSDKYQLTSLLAFYVKGHPITYSINLGRRMNEYDMWPGINDAFHAIERNRTYPVPVNGIFVTDGDSNLSPVVASAFERCNRRLKDTTEHGMFLRHNTIFTCYNFKGIDDKKAETY